MRALVLSFLFFSTYCACGVASVLFWPFLPDHIVDGWTLTPIFVFIVSDSERVLAVGEYDLA
jgi:hypothetical protein